MSMLWYLKYRRWRLRRAFAKDVKAVEERKGSHDEFNQVYADYHYDLEQAEQVIDEEVGTRLFNEARSLDVEIPGPSANEMWMRGDDGSSRWFSPKGRAHVRKLIDEEKSRRFEVKTLWVTKFWLPLLAALVGIIGALTGLVAVLEHKK